VVKLFKVIFSRQARQRLRAISDRYERISSPSVARKIRNGIVDQAQKLERFPEKKPILPDTEDYDPAVRYTKAWRYKIIFSVFKKKGQVRITTIRHDKEDPENIKGNL
jgi:plasmid stabilization system protein ParE